MARLSPQEAAAKWASRAAAAQGDYAQGVQNVTQAPGQAAAAAADKWQQNVQTAKEKYRARVGAVSREEWVAAAVQKGAPRFATGVQQAQGKMAAFTAEFFPFLDQVTARTKNMPSITIEQRIQRMVEQARGTAQFRRRGMTGGA